MGGFLLFAVAERPGEPGAPRPEETTSAGRQVAPQEKPLRVFRTFIHAMTCDVLQRTNRAGGLLAIR